MFRNHLRRRTTLTGRTILIVSALCLLAAGLFACVPSEGPKLPFAQRQVLRLTSVDVDYTRNAAIYISPIIDEINDQARLAVRGVTPEEMRETQRKAITDLLKTDFQKIIRPILNGERPVVARIIISRVNVPGPAMTFVVGGDTDMVGGVDLVDPKTEAVLEHIDASGVSASQYRGGGLIRAVVNGVVDANNPSNEQVRILVESFTRQYGEWLQRQ